MTDPPMTSIGRRDRVVVRALTDDPVDMAAMSAWLSDPRVLEWFEGRDRPYTLDDVVREYSPRSLDEHGVNGAIIEHDGAPVGYVQYFRVDRYAVEYGLAADDDLADVWACDMFIGVPEMWGRGIGTASMSAVLDHLFVVQRARRVLIDPRVVNERAVHLYQKVGFRRVKVLSEHEFHEGQAWDNLLMEVHALDHPVGLTAALARIDSVNPHLVPGAAGEAAISSFIERWCIDRDLEVHRAEVSPGRWNVIAVNRGSGGGRSVLFNGHMDTVGVTDPDTMQVRLDDGRLTGRGVLDTKGGLAGALLAAASVRPGELAGDIVVAAVADEEYASIGTEALVTEWTADGAVVLEPTDLQIVARHRGFAVIEAVFEGRPSHTSRPERGANAVHAAARAVAAVAALDEQWSSAADGTATRPSALCGRVLSHGETFTVPARCELTVELRTTAEGPDAQVAAATSALESAAGDTTVVAAVALTRPPMDVGDDPLVHALAAALEGVGGAPAVVAAAPYWTDAALHVQAGTPAVVFGPEGQGLHEDLEWVTTESLERCAATLRALVRTWCA